MLIHSQIQSFMIWFMLVSLSMLSISMHVSSSDRIEYVFSDSDWVSDV